MDDSCPVCYGSGSSEEICTKCRGTGIYRFRIFWFWTGTMPCGGCFCLAQDRATGYTKCKHCRGTGSRYAR